MTNTTDETHGPIVAAVQTALTDFGMQVKREIDALRSAVAAEKAGREHAETQIAELFATHEQKQQQSAAQHVELRQLVETNNDATETTVTQRLDANTSRFDALEARTTASAELVRDTDTRLTGLESRTDASTDASNELGARLNAVETQASELSADITKRLAERASIIDALDARTTASEALVRETDTRLTGLESRTDASTDASNELGARLNAVETQASELSADVAERVSTIHAVAASAAGAVAAQAALESRFDASDAKLQDDLDTAVAALKTSAGADLAAAESRLAERASSAEKTMLEGLQTRFSELDSEFERVASGVETSMTDLNERSNDIDERVGDLIDRVKAIEAIVAEIDVDVIDELSERVSAAAGEAVLVRIEAERFQESVKETNDQILLRISELEAQLQDQEMDVETAVQLERLEEIERALIELDPAQFVRVDDPGSSAGERSAASEVPFVSSSGETGDVVAGRADDSKPPEPTLPSSQA